MKLILAGCLLTTLLYSCIGTSYNVPEIRKIAPADISSRGWKILRYEGYQYGSWGKNGGYAWYHVQDKRNENIQ